jgi:hypothetical protein
MELSIERVQNRWNLLCDLHFVDLHGMDSHTASCGEFLVTDIALEMLSLASDY